LCRLRREQRHQHVGGVQALRPGQKVRLLEARS